MNGDGGEALRRCLPDDLFELYAETSRITPDRRESIVLDDQLGVLSSQPHLGPPNDAPRPHTGVHRRTLRQILLARLGDSFRPIGQLRGVSERAAFACPFTSADGRVRPSARGELLTLHFQDDGPVSSGYPEKAYRLLSVSGRPPEVDHRRQLQPLGVRPRTAHEHTNQVGARRSREW
jgi:hypothetical protein